MKRVVTKQSNSVTWQKCSVRHVQWSNMEVSVDKKKSWITGKYVLGLDTFNRKVDFSDIYQHVQYCYNTHI